MNPRISKVINVLAGQKFGENPQIYKKFGLAGHNGIDYPAALGTKVYACDTGYVQLRNDPTGYGKNIKIIHPWGESIYGHLQKYAVQNGQIVGRSEHVGYVDSTGFSTGNHLHFGIRVTGVANPKFYDWIDPSIYFIKPTDMIQNEKEVEILYVLSGQDPKGQNLKYWIGKGIIELAKQLIRDRKSREEKALL